MLPRGAGPLAWTVKSDPRGSAVPALQPVRFTWGPGRGGEGHKLSLPCGRCGSPGGLARGGEGHKATGQQSRGSFMVGRGREHGRWGSISQGRLSRVLPPHMGCRGELWPRDFRRTFLERTAPWGWLPAASACGGN